MSRKDTEEFAEFMELWSVRYLVNLHPPRLPGESSCWASGPLGQPHAESDSQTVNVVSAFQAHSQVLNGSTGTV